MKSDLSSLFNNAKKVTLVSVPIKEEEPEKEIVEEETTKKSKKKTNLEDDEEEKEDEDEEEEDDEDEDPSIANAQTVFVGNVPIACTQKELKKLFSEFGTIEAIRLRNLIPLNPKRGKRLAFIKKEFHPLQKTITAFVRFSNEKQARSATILNGFLFDEHHLRVDMAHERDEDFKHDYKRSIFIGNLPFDANDDDVWRAFEECGQIESVRLVRDRETSVGKGFGYVLFQDEASVALALSLNGNCQVGNRQIRIKTAVKKPKRPKPGRPAVFQKKYPQQNKGFKSKKTIHSNDDDGVQQGRVGKRPSVILRKEKQKKKKRHLSIKTNSTRKDVIQLKKKN